jgi:ABC-type protease/lipase transport system fused ATPase/permease subunit
VWVYQTLLQLCLMVYANASDLGLVSSPEVSVNGWAIARALLQRPCIVILDEATACLDCSSEQKMLRTIRQTLSASTIIVVSHRLSILSTFERILVLREGRIVEDGKPASFIAVQKWAMSEPASTPGSD